MIAQSFSAEKAILTGSAWLAGLPEPFRAAIISNWVWQRITPSQTLSHGGDETGGMIGLASGTALVFPTMGIADAGPIHAFQPPYWYGLNPSTEGRPRFVSVVARTVCVVARIPQHVIAGLLLAHPVFWRHMHELTMMHLEITAQTAADLAIRDSKRRLVAVMLRAAGVRQFGDTPVRLDLSQDDISSMANISRQTTGALFNEFKIEGLLAAGYRSVKLADPAAMRRLLQS